MGILVAGLLAGALIIATAADDDGAAAAIAADRMYQHNLELLGGKFGVLLVELGDWFASLWHGRTLGYTVGFLAIAIALICCLLARVMPPPAAAHEKRGRDS